MEPNIIDYYNELPNSVNVIDKLNDEYNNLLEKYDKLKEKYDNNKITILGNPPRVIVNSVNEFLVDYEDKLKNLENIIKDVFNSNTELFINHKPFDTLSYDIWWSLKDDGDIDDVRGIFYPIYNEMNIITNNQNPKWCKVKLKDTLDELCKLPDNFKYAKHYIRNDYVQNNIEENHTRYEIPPGKWIESKLNIDNIICFMINNLVGEEDDRMGDENVIAGLRTFKCNRCGQIDNYIPDDHDEMLYCGECHPNNQY